MQPSASVAAQAVLITILFGPTLVSSSASPFPLPEPAAAAYPASTTNTVSIRVEGPSSTVYEGTITSGPRNITVSAQNDNPNNLITFSCDGIGAGAHTTPGNTPTCALDAVAKAHGFAYNGSFDGEFNDAFIDTIAGIASFPNNVATYWGLLWNYQYPKFGEGVTLSGCQQEIGTGDEVLWAYAAHNTQGIRYLKITPRRIAVKAGGSAGVKVSDGMSGAVVAGARVHGVTTDVNGMATLKFPHTGTFKYKATRSGDVRSAQVTVVVR